MRARLHFVAIVAGLLLSACATAPEPEPDIGPVEDPRIEALLAAVEARREADPQVLPRGLEISVAQVWEADGQMMFDVLIAAPEARARDAQDYTVYVSCLPAQIAACADKLVDAARLLK